MPDWFDMLFVKTWWRYPAGSPDSFAGIYHWLNLAEGAAWLVFAGLVFRRSARRGHSSLEIAYGIAFLTFALSNFREAWAQSSWLIWLKLVNLMALFRLRRTVMTRYYPDAKVY